jgi:MprA protease rhombosortase-interaction domain-containing protein
LKNCLFIGALSSVVVTSMSSAALMSFTGVEAFNLATSAIGATQYIENFDDLSGYYSNPLSGTMGGVTWSASAFGGLFVGQVDSNAALSTALAVPLTIDFSGNDVRALSGNFFGTNQGFTVVASFVKITLLDGTSHTGYINTNSSTAFLGFYSTNSAITRITISLPIAFGFAYPTVDNLTIAVIPAPSALALIGLAGFSRRRRR